MKSRPIQSKSSIRTSGQRATRIRSSGRKDIIASLKRANVKIQIDTANIDALQKELSDLKHYDTSLTKDIRDLQAKHP